MVGHRGQNEMRLPRMRWWQCRLSRRSTKPAFLINVLILMALMRGIDVLAVHAPLNDAQVGRSVRDNTMEENYQSNYEDDAATVSAALSTGYNMAHNYYQNAASHSVADDTLTYGDAAGDTTRFDNLQRFRDATDVGFIPTTMTAAGQHYIAAERDAGTKHARLNTAAPPQIGGIRTTGRYRMPAGKIDYEINAANYDVTSETANSKKAVDEQNTGVIEANDAYNVALLQDMMHLQQQQQRQQKHEQHQLAYTAENTPTEQDNVDDMISFKNYDSTPASTLPYTEETKHQLQHQQQQQYQHHHHQQQQQQQDQQLNTNEQYLHNLQMLQYANYEHKPKQSYLYNEEIFAKSRQPNQPYSYVAYEQPTGNNNFRINLHAQEQVNYQQRQQQQQQKHRRQLKQIHENVYSDDNLKLQSQHYYTHARTPHDRSINLHDSHRTINSFQSRLPAITHTAHHTPASSAAVAGIPLSRHVEVVRHVPVPHFKREHIPYNQSVPIEIPQPMITTIPKPIPINVPVSQTVAVPQLQVVRIPIEKIKPMPVERAVPFIVEKRVPYQVEKQVAKPVYYPYPIRVPVVTTVVHKLPHHNYHHHHHAHPRQVLYAQQTLLAVCAIMSIVYDETTIAAKTSSTTALTTAEVHVGLAHKNMAAYANQAKENQKQQKPHGSRPNSGEEHQQKRPQRGSYRYGSSNSNVNGDDGAAASDAAHLYGVSSSTWKKSKTRRSYSKNVHGDPTTATFNDLTNLPTGLQHISDSYGNAFMPLSAITGRMVREQIPIYEEQQENDYDHAAVAAAAAAAAVSASGDATPTTSAAETTIATTGYASENNQHHQSNGYERDGNGDGSSNGPYAQADDALRTAIYNLRTAGTHTGFLPSLGTSSSSSSIINTMNNYPYGKYVTAAQQIAPTPQETHNFNDKISADGNFLHHYEHNSGYDELSAPDAYQQQQQQQQQQKYLLHHQQLQQQQYQQQQQQQQEWQLQQQQPPYLTTHASNALPEFDGVSPSHTNYEPPTNYLPEQNTHPQGIGNLPPDVINYIPYPVVKKLHVPVHQPVQIPISQAIIMPVSKPVPIHIPIPKQVHIPIEKELRIPVERVVPYPVEKNVPVPVEKRVPYPVVKYVPVKVPQPFPVKVPVLKTILHKIKSWW